MKALALSYLQVSPSKRRIRRRKLTATAKALTESTVTDGSGQGNTSRAPSATAVQPQSVLEMPTSLDCCLMNGMLPIQSFY